MKLSDKLLMGLLVAGVLTLVGSTMALKAEHDKIDFTDPFYGFSSIALKPFRFVKIEGTKKSNMLTRPDKWAGSLPDKTYSNTTMSVQRGNRYELRVQKASQVPFTYRYAGDTLIVAYEPEIFARQFGPAETAVDMPFVYINSPFAYIMAPSLQTIIAEDVTCKVVGFSTESVAMVANRARVYLSQCTIGNLTWVGQRGSLFQTSPANRIRRATIVTGDSSSFVAEQDAFGSLLLNSDSTATLKLPASLLKKVVFTN